MNLSSILSVMYRRKWLLVFGGAVGLVLAFSWSYSVRLADSGWAGGGIPLEITKRSNAQYESSLGLIVDVPGFGLGRTDVQVNKAFDMTPTFAILATSDAVRERVPKSVRSGGISVEARPVERSPVFMIVAQGQDPRRVAEAANAYATAIIEYVAYQQERNSVPEDSRLSVRTLSEASHATQISSRDLEVAVILFLSPLGLAVLLAFAVDNVARSRAGTIAPSAASAEHGTSGLPAPSTATTQE